MRTPEHCHPRARHAQRVRTRRSLWCLAALFTVAATACGDAPGPAATDAPEATAGSTEDEATTEPLGTEGSERGLSGADAEAVAEALAATGWPRYVVVEAQAYAAAWPAEGGSSEDLARILPSPPGMRVVAFGSLDGDGRSDPVPIAGATVVAVPEQSWFDWWDAVTGLDLTLDLREEPPPGSLVPVIGLPPGAQLRGDAVQALRQPGALVATTGADGTAHLAPRPGVRYHLCVLSPGVEGVVAGCEYDFRPDSYYTSNPPDGLSAGAGYDTVMVYFSYGRAYLGGARDDDPDTNRDDDDFYWFQRIAETVFGLGLALPPGVLATGPQTKPATATVDFMTPENIGRGNLVAFIEDSQIGGWWDAISTGRDSTAVRRAALESSPATLVHLEHDPVAHERFWGSTTLHAGTYLICWLRAYPPDTAREFRPYVCAYEEFPADTLTQLWPYPIEFASHLRSVRIHDAPQ